MLLIVGGVAFSAGISSVVWLSSPVYSVSCWLRLLLVPLCPGRVRSYSISEQLCLSQVASCSTFNNLYVFVACSVLFAVLFSCLRPGGLREALSIIAETRD